MRTIELNKKQLPLFKELDPFGFMKKKEMEDPAVKLGAVYEGEEEARPAGLLLGDTSDRELKLRWLFVDPFLRRRSYGEQLLAKAFQEAKDRGLERMRIAFPKEYGYETICRHDHLFFRRHGFTEAEDGTMTASVADFTRLTEYHGPSFMDEVDMLDKLLADDVEDVEDPTGDFDSKEAYVTMHKPWDTKETTLSIFSSLPNLHSLLKRIMPEKNKIMVGSIGDLTFTQFRDGIELCERNNHTGYLKSLKDTPLEYFEIDISSYSMSDDRVTGFTLVHYNEQEHKLITELYFSADGNNQMSLMGMLRYTLLKAVQKYTKDTKLVFPLGEKIHVSFIKRIFGE